MKGDARCRDVWRPKKSGRKGGRQCRGVARVETGDQLGMEARGILGFGLEGESGKEGCPSNV